VICFWEGTVENFFADHLWERGIFGQSVWKGADQFWKGADQFWRGSRDFFAATSDHRARRLELMPKKLWRELARNSNCRG
jgi:hypothetical protein